MDYCSESYIEDNHDFNSSTDEKIKEIINITNDNYTKDNILNLLDSTFHNLNELENKSNLQEKEILDIMFSYHWYLTQVNSLKLLMPTQSKRILQKKIISKEDVSNVSMNSKASKRSVTTLKNDSKKFGAHKVSINIGDVDNRTPKNSTNSRKSTNLDFKSLEKNLKPKNKNNVTPITIRNVKVLNKTEKAIKTISQDDDLDIKARNAHGASKSTNVTTDSLSFTSHAKLTYKLEPKKKLLINSQSGNIATINTNITPKKDSDIDMNHIRTSSEKGKNNNLINDMYKSSGIFFTNENNSNIFIKLFEFSNNVKEKLKLKNISKQMRKKFYQFEIHNLEKLKNYKQSQINPFSALKVNDYDVFFKKFVLSEHLMKYEKDDEFKNIVKIIHVILFPNNNPNRSLKELISEIECSVNKDNNIYSKYKEILNNLRTKEEVYKRIKSLYDLNSNIFDVDRLNSIKDINILIDLVRSIKKILTNFSPKLELMLDIEIINHKIETLKNLNIQIK